MKDFFAGIQLILLRRHSSAGRRLKFEITGGAKALISEENTIFFTDEMKLELTLVMQELCTNCLKHGKGITQCRFSFENGSLTISLTNDVSHKKNSFTNTTQTGSKTLHYRIARLNGTFSEICTENRFTIKLVIPVKSSHHSLTKE